MLDVKEKIGKTLDELGMTRPEQVYQLFSILRSNFDAEIFSVATGASTAGIHEVGAKWLNAPIGILPQINGKWVHNNSSPTRDPAQRAYSHLLAHIKTGLKAVQTLDQLGVSEPAKVIALFDEVRQSFDQDIALDRDQRDLEITRQNWLGRRTGIMTWVSDRWVKQARKDVKPAVGQSFNQLKSHIEANLETRRRDIEDQAARAWASTAADSEWHGPIIQRNREEMNLRAALQVGNAETGPVYVPESSPGPHEIGEDLSLPGVMRPLGSRHPLRQTLEEIERIFLSLGYTVVAGPEMETPYYNFEALNIPEHHPARDNMDTFYMATPPGAGPLLLRTHTSPMQVRTMEKQQPPVRIIVPGKVYRRDNPDATHGFIFHQIEGLAVDTDITFCDFKGTVEYFVREFLGPKVKTRLRPSYFPFTEPSVEIDATCVFCGGPGCSVCKQSGWIELFGAGMVDPAVYGFVNYDAKRLSGFAFGMGVERLTQLKYNINDLQLYFQNDVRFLSQFQ
jgi:phenylalanyl-tRNA synthetase alpha chain